jgi:DNA-binding IclR family transcriptional regulator
MSGLDVLYLHKIVGSHGIHLPSRVGARIPVHLPALGKALLAFASEHTIAARVRHGLERRTSYSVGDAHRLTDQLDEIRSSHVAIEREEVRLGVCCVGVPILSPDGTVVASMSVASPINTFTPSTLAAVLGDAARRISESIPASMVLHDQDAQCVASAPRRGA